MTEEIELKGTLLEHRIAQAKADIIEIDAKVTALQLEAEGLRTKQIEIHKVLKKLEAPDVVATEEETPDL